MGHVREIARVSAVSTIAMLLLACIVEQDGGGGQPDPPVNLMGTHLVVPEDFSLRVSFENVTSDATLAVYDSPPVIADEIRIEPAGLQLTLRGDDLQIAIFDGSAPQDVTDPQPARVEQVTVGDPEAEISVHRSGDRLEIASGGATVSSLALADVLTSGELWLGLTSDGGSFTVSSFVATAPGRASLATALPAAADAEPSADGLQALSPRQGEYSFAEADALLDFAERKGIAVHGHTIAFTEAMPRWMQDLPTGTEEERRASAEALLDYVSTVVTHFAGRLVSLDVVNEPFDVDQGTDLQENIWFRVFGPAYPVVVSRAVHDADPDVKQFINENGADVTDGDGQEAQAEQYATVLSTCLGSDACVSYTTWGVDDEYDWWIDDDGRLHQAHDFLFADSEPTPAYAAMREALRG